MTFTILFGSTDELRAQLEQKFMAAFDELKAKIDDVSATLDAEHQQVADAIAALEAQLAAMLTPEQFAELGAALDTLKVKAAGIYEPPSPPNS